MKNEEAGKGEHHVYRIEGDGDPLVRHQHYLGIDAVSWYLNKASGWWTDFTASGTVTISLVDKREQYSVALATYELNGGARTAPSFNQTLLPDRQFRGGAIEVQISLISYKKDRALASLLKGAASASLGVVAGMVETASVAGPATILTKAGSHLIDGVQKSLTSAEKQTSIFGSEGVSVGLRAGDIRGDETYYLIHRGSELDPGKLSVDRSGTMPEPFHDGAALEDGAWILLRFRRSATYKGERPWAEKARTLRQDVRNLVEDVEHGDIPRDEAAEHLRSSANGGADTLYDRYRELRHVIQADGVLTEKEAREEVRALSTVIRNARDEIRREPEETTRGGDSTGLESLGGGEVDLVAAEVAEFERYRHSVRPDIGDEPAATAPTIRVLP